MKTHGAIGLNPYCSGRKNRIIGAKALQAMQEGVLILIVVEERIGYGLMVHSITMTLKS